MLLTAAITEMWNVSIVKILVNLPPKFFDWTLGPPNMPGPLNRAATNETVAIFIAIVKSAKLRLTFSDPRDSGRTPLHAACRVGALQTVNYLLRQNGIQTIIDSKDDQGRTPLSYASENGHIRIVYQLLSSGNPAYLAIDNEGRSPLDYSKRCFEIGFMFAWRHEWKRRGKEAPLLSFERLMRECARYRAWLATRQRTGQ